jgi:hypothetical protein
MILNLIYYFFISGSLVFIWDTMHHAVVIQMLFPDVIAFYHADFFSCFKTVIFPSVFFPLSI